MLFIIIFAGKMKRTVLWDTVQYRVIIRFCDYIQANDTTRPCRSPVLQNNCNRNYKLITTTPVQVNARSGTWRYREKHSFPRETNCRDHKTSTKTARIARCQEG